MEQVIQTNFTGLVHCTRKGFHLIQKSDDYGIIINIGSIVGHYVPNGEYKFNVYPGTKHALRATTEVMRLELVRKNNTKIRVAVRGQKLFINRMKNKLLSEQEISPGVVATEIMEASGALAKYGNIKMDQLGIPFLRDADVSQTVMFLLMTPHSVNITELVIRPTGEKM